MSILLQRTGVCGQIMGVPKSCVCARNGKNVEDISLARYSHDKNRF